MNIKVTKRLLLDAIAAATSDERGLSSLRTLVFNHYYAEDNYAFESEVLKDIFAVLAVYLEGEEAFGDERRGARLGRLAKTFEQGGWSPEHALFAMYYDEIERLSEKLRGGLISRQVFTSQIKKLSPLNLDWDRIILWADDQWAGEGTRPETPS